MGEDDQLVYENHNLIYAYGSLERYKRVLASMAFHEAPISVPTPHCHNYHPQFDQAEKDILSHWEWRRYDLKTQDLE